MLFNEEEICSQIKICQLTMISTHVSVTFFSPFQHADTFCHTAVENFENIVSKGSLLSPFATRYPTLIQ